MIKKWEALLAVLIVLLLLLIPRPYLILKDFRSDTIFWQTPIEASTRFTVEWIHSVELTPWRETFRPRWPKGIELVETSFRSYGVGVPSNIGRQTKVIDGWVVASGISQIRNSVVYLISRPDYQLIIGDRTIPMQQIVPKDASVEIMVKWKLW